MTVAEERHVSGASLVARRRLFALKKSQQAAGAFVQVVFHAWSHSLAGVRDT
jgi:hypothetical protein